MTELRFPVKLNDDYPCQGMDATGRQVTFDDLLQEADRVGSRTYGTDVFGPWGVVVRRENGLWVEAEIGPGDVEVGRIITRAARQVAA